jgi:Arc/MetJ family transcription regulator
MRTTITIEDELFERASNVTGLKNASELVKIALNHLVTAESRKRLIALGGSAPNFSIPGRGVDSGDDAIPRGLVAENSPEYNDPS